MNLMKQIEKPTRIIDILERNNNGKKNNNAFRLFRNGGWRHYNVQEYKENCDLISHALMHYGVRRGDTIALIASSRPEWNMIDMGVMQIGGVMLPLDTNLEAETYLEVMKRANVHILILENKELLNRFKLLFPQMETLKEIFTIDISNVSESFGELLDCGRQHANPEELEKRLSILSPDDVCTLCIMPDGQMEPLTHKQMMVKIEEASERISTSGSPAVSNTPLYKLDERMNNYALQYLGREITCLPDGQTSEEQAEHKKGRGSGRKLNAMMLQLLTFHFSF